MSNIRHFPTWQVLANILPVMKKIVFISYAVLVKASLPNKFYFWRQKLIDPASREGFEPAHKLA
jgi:hypothetical protein